MKLEQSFEVQAPIDQVWAALVDVERVAPCLPGASVTGRNHDGSYNGSFTIKIGPTTASYTGKLEMQSIDESSHTATIYAQGSDKRGQGGATATISSRLSPLDGRTQVDVATDYHITGRLARFGRGGMIEDISERLLREFASRLQASLTYSGAEPGGEGAGEEPGEAAGRVAGGVDGGVDEALAPAPIEESEQPTTETDVAGEPATQAYEAPPEPEPPITEQTPGEPEPAAAEALTEALEVPAEPQPPVAEAEEPPPAPPHDEPPAPPPPPHAAPPPPPPRAAPPPPRAAPPPPHEASDPIKGLSLVGSVLLARIKKNPARVIGVLGGLLLLRLLFRRR